MAVFIQGGKHFHIKFNHLQKQLNAFVLLRADYLYYILQPHGNTKDSRDKKRAGIGDPCTFSWRPFMCLKYLASLCALQGTEILLQASEAHLRWASS